MKLLKEIKLNPNFNESDIFSAINKKYKIAKKDINSYEIIKQGIDARKKPDVKYVLNIAVSPSDKSASKFEGFEDVDVDHSGLKYPCKKSKYSPVIVGFGPSGMFTALTLAIAGLKPIVLEQGKDVKSRQADVESFWKNGVLNTHSNVQFGEGGAGTFSDGKLNTTLNNPHCKKVINELILNGAPYEIFYKNKAHIGTDNLKIVVKNIREKIIKLGGKVIFNAKFNDFSLKNGKIESISYINLNNNKMEKILTDKLILAIGHSAIDTFELLNDKKIKMRAKPFAMGVRVEHKQSLINLSQYGKEHFEGLPSADYKLVEHLPNGRSVFTFCMCPGGVVVASSSENGTIVTNGMSEFARDKEFANSALLVNVNPEDYMSGSVLSGLYYQRKYEKMAFELAGGSYKAPAQTIGEFLSGDLPKKVNNCTYRPGIKPCEIKKCLPEYIVESLKIALPLFDKKITGFAGENNLLIAIESRSSCPVQFDRDDSYKCTICGLYACGEGAGYAGGIISSAVDGVKCAERIMENI